MDVFECQLLVLVVQDELKQEPPRGRDPHLIGFKNVGEIFVLFHDSGCPK